MKRLITTILVAAAVSAPIPALACDGIETVDGCMTIEQYNEIFSLENLANTESLAMPGQSVAEVYGITDDGVEPADRPREFMGEELPTIREVIEGRLWVL